MKNRVKLFGIIALAAVMTFALVFTACPDSSNDDNNDNPGGGVPNVQNVQVYNEDGTSYTGSGKVSMYIYGESIEMEEEVGNITNGKLSLTLPDIPASIVNKGITFAFVDSYTDTDGDFTVVNTVISEPNVSQADAKYLVSGDFDVRLANNDWSRLGYGSVSTNQYVLYLYCDKAVTVSGVYNSTRVYTSSLLTVTYNNISTWSCSVNKGWNVVYVIGSDTDDGLTYISTISTSPVGNATDFKWIIAFHDDN